MSDNKSKLTAKQENFCQACQVMNDSDAYRHAYNTKRMKTETINRCAFELKNNPKITARIQELEKQRDDKEADLFLKNPLTSKEQCFCQILDRCHSQKQAAILAGYSENSATSIASENLTKPNILAYLKHIRQRTEDEAIDTRLSIVDEFEVVRLSAIANLDGYWNAANTASMNKAKLLGFCVDRIETKHTGDIPEGMPGLYTQLEAETVQKELDERLRLAEERYNAKHQDDAE